MENDLIKAVKTYPCLYDKNHIYYRNKQCISKTWRLIAEEIGYSETLCKKRWKSLRDRYVRETKQRQQSKRFDEKLNSKWPFHEKLAFLDSFLGPSKGSKRGIIEYGPSLSINSEGDGMSRDKIDPDNCLASYDDENVNIKISFCENDELIEEDEEEIVNSFLEDIQDNSNESSVPKVIVASEKSANEDYLKVLDDFLCKLDEDKRDCAKIKILQYALKQRFDFDADANIV